MLHRGRQESGMKEMWHERNEKLGMLGAWARVQSTEPPDMCMCRQLAGSPDHVNNRESGNGASETSRSVSVTLKSIYLSMTFEVCV